MTFSLKGGEKKTIARLHKYSATPKNAQHCLERVVQSDARQHRVCHLDLRDIVLLLDQGLFFQEIHVRFLPLLVSDWDAVDCLQVGLAEHQNWAVQQTPGDCIVGQVHFDELRKTFEFVQLSHVLNAVVGQIESLQALQG